MANGCEECGWIGPAVDKVAVSINRHGVKTLEHMCPNDNVEDADFCGSVEFYDVEEE